MEEQDYRTTFELEESNWWFVGMRRIYLALLDLALPADAEAVARRRILDVGCGTGVVLADLRRYGAPVGIDVSPTALAFCRARGERRLVLGSGDGLPFTDGSFDAVTAFGVIEHIDDDRAALSEWARILKPGGPLVLLTSAYPWLWSGHDVSNHHKRRYYAREVAGLLAGAGLVPRKVSYVNTLLFPPIFTLRMAERVARGRRPPKPRKDTAEVPGPVNTLFLGLLDLERLAIRRWRLPFGVSIVALAEKPGGQTSEGRASAASLRQAG